MRALRDFLDVLQSIVFIGLGIVAVWRWVARRGAARAWLAGTFGILGSITAMGLVLPESPDAGSVAGVATRFLVALLAFFPYLLFRFAATFRRRTRAVEIVALAVTAVVVLGAFAIREFPDQGASWSTSFATWAVLLLVQWVGLTGIVANELWRAGRGQPTVSRRRMRLLSLASVGLALALVLSAAGGGGEEDEDGDGAAGLVTQLLALAAAPMFLIGFAPPQALLASWRRPELEELRAAEEVLLRALSPADVGQRLLPHVTKIIGGQASALFGDDGTLLGADGIATEEATEFFDDPQHADEVISLPVRAGRLVVRATPYTPYFARSEADLLTRLATFTDLALSRAELSERERQTAIELQAANEAMREFVAIASHDLRTPVTVIKGFASTLEHDWEHVPDPQRQQFLSTIRRHSDHLGVIIDDLLTSSRLDAGVLEPSPKTIEVGPFVERVIGDLGRAGEAEVVVPNGLTAFVDEEHLQRMLTNYLVNAFRYGAPPVTVHATRRGEDEVEIVVADRGEGVPADFEPRVFEKFARVDKRHSRDNQGTGLGLAIVRGLARTAGGDAWYERNHPGACFGLRLPATGPA